MADDASEAGSNVIPTNESIFGQSEPDQPAPQVVAAADHASNVHPFFAGAARGASGRGAARGRGRGRGRGRDGGSTSGTTAATSASPAGGAIIQFDSSESGPQFVPISARELEFSLRRNADGAESSAFSDDNDDEEVQRKKRRRSKRPMAAATERPPTDDPDGEMAAAAFGGAATGADDDYEDDEEGEEGEEGDVESSVGGNRMLPIRGERCVGCTCDRAIVSVVDAFVRQHATSMQETALYKAAALYYHREIVLPRRAEGVRVQPWSWKDLRAHYVLHVCDPVLQRAAACRSLGQVRAVQEGALLKINPDGTKSLDNKGAELLLKIITLQDRQLSALDTAMMPPPPSRR